MPKHVSINFIQLVSIIYFSSAWVPSVDTSKSLYCSSKPQGLSGPRHSTKVRGLFLTCFQTASRAELLQLFVMNITNRTSTFERAATTTIFGALISAGLSCYFAVLRALWQHRNSVFKNPFYRLAMAMGFLDCILLFIYIGLVQVKMCVCMCVCVCVCVSVCVSTTCEFLLKNCPFQLPIFALGYNYLPFWLNKPLADIVVFTLITSYGSTISIAINRYVAMK